MSELWRCVGFAVFDGEHDADAIRGALPVPSRIVERGPRRHALAATIHDGTSRGGNITRFAVFSADGRTFVAPPGGVSNRTGEVHWQRALSARFGRVHWFGIFDVTPVVQVFERGAPLAITSSWPTENDVLEELSTFLGVEDARTYLSIPGGDSTILEAESGRW